MSYKDYLSGKVSLLIQLNRKRNSSMIVRNGRRSDDEEQTLFCKERMRSRLRILANRGNVFGLRADSETETYSVALVSPC